MAYIMLAGPHEKTMEDAIKNIDEMLKLDADYAAFAVFSPYPNTESFDEGAQKGLYPADCWDQLMEDPLCGVEVPVSWTEHLTKAEILDLLKIAHRKFYFRPKFLARQVMNLKTPTEFKRSPPPLPRSIHGSSETLSWNGPHRGSRPICGRMDEIR